MKKLDSTSMENLYGGDWWDFLGCMVGCHAECMIYSCSNAAEDCLVGCTYATL